MYHGNINQTEIKMKQTLKNLYVQLLLWWCTFLTAFMTYGSKKHALCVVKTLKRIVSATGYLNICELFLCLGYSDDLHNYLRFSNINYNWMANVLKYNGKVQNYYREQFFNTKDDVLNFLEDVRKHVIRLDNLHHLTKDKKEILTKVRKHENN